MEASQPSSSTDSIPMDHSDSERRSNRRRKRPFPQHITPPKKSCSSSGKKELSTQSSELLSNLLLNTKKNQALFLKSDNSILMPSQSSSSIKIDVQPAKKSSEVLEIVSNNQVIPSCSLIGFEPQKQTQNEISTPENLEMSLKIENSPKKNVSPSTSHEHPKVTKSINDIELSEIIEGMNDEINNMLEETAEKKNLTATNVKNILRHVITNEYVLAMVRNTMKADNNEDDELEDAVFEPKLTRSKAKELREKQAALPWPVSSPVKQNTQQISKKLLEEEFSEDDNSSDEEYQPNEEECHSEEEEPSSKGSITGSPQSEKILSSSPEKTVHWDIEPPLVIADVPEAVSTHEIDQIALRTRSKLPLVDTPLEMIEASFVAPDITVDMYDTECDDEDWQQFLLEFSKPLDIRTSLEQPDDDVENDPEYNALEEDDDDDDKKTVKISQKELNALMASILETAEQELIDFEEEEEDDLNIKANDNVTLEPLIPTQPEEVVEQYTSSEVLESDWFTPFERLQLEEQLRMHVQLLTQSYILSYGIRELSDVTNSSTALLDELKIFSCRSVQSRKKSYFYAENLDESLNIITTYKAERASPTSIISKSQDKRNIPQKAKTIMAHSKVFIYPHLLPTVGFKPSITVKSRVYFTEAEDLLLALGLEQFSVLDNPLNCIQSLLLPTKTVAQIKLRIKNLKGSKGSTNPIKYFYLNARAPPISPSVRTFDSATLKAPYELSSDVLPSWMGPYLKNRPPLAPSPIVQTPKIAVVHPILQKTAERRRYQRILPRVSPFKKISPFMKKYVQHRRVIPVAPLTPMVAKTSPESVLKQSLRMVSIRPKPSVESQNIPILPKPAPNDINMIPVTIAPCFLPMKNQIIEASIGNSTVISSSTSPTCTILKSTSEFPVIVDSTITTTLQPEPNFVASEIPGEIKPEPMEASSSNNLVNENISSDQSFTFPDTATNVLPNNIEKVEMIENKPMQCNVDKITEKEPKLESEKKRRASSPNKKDKIDRSKRETTNKNESKIHEKGKTNIETKKDKMHDAVKMMETIQNKSSTTKVGKEKSMSSVNIISTVKEKSTTLSHAAKEKSTSIQGGNITKEKSTVTTHTNNVGKEKPVTRAATARNENTQEVETAEDADDEAVDDEQDLAALMVASSTICKKQNPSSKKKNKHQRDLESTLQLLVPNILENDPKKEDREKIFAQSYLLRVMEALKNDPVKCESFLKLLCSYEYSTKSPIKLFSEVQDILRDHPPLVDEFVAFLSAEQAKECGKFIQHTSFDKIRIFLRKMEIHFSNQPHHIQRILRTLSQLQNQTNLTSANVISALQPLLRNQSHLLEEFLQLLPDEPPPEWLMTDFEEVKIPLSDGDNSSCDSFEEVTIPEVKDPYGGKDCPCPCHSTNTDVRAQNKNKHCVKCGTKFIDGRIYIQTGKVLKPAQVIYSSINPLPQVKPDTTKNSEIVSKHNLINERHKKEIQNLPSVSESCFSSTSRTISSFPCNVIEDAVLPPVPSSSFSSSIPSDFSHLQEAFTSHAKNTAPLGNKECSKHVTVKITENTSNSLRLKFTGIESKSSSSKSRADHHSSHSINVSRTSVTDNWTRDQDKIVIDTCKALGVNKDAFRVAATKLPGKTVEQCDERLQMLIKMLEQHLKTTKR